MHNGRNGDWKRCPASRLRFSWFLDPRSVLLLRRRTIGGTVFGLSDLSPTHRPNSIEMASAKKSHAFGMGSGYDTSPLKGCCTATLAGGPPIVGRDSRVAFDKSEGRYSKMMYQIDAPSCERKRREKHAPPAEASSRSSLADCTFVAHAADLRRTAYFAKLKFRGSLHKFTARDTGPHLHG